MYDHIVPMMYLSREELISLMDKKRESVEVVRAKVKAACDPTPDVDGIFRVPLEGDSKPIKDVFALFDEIDAEIAYSREHLDPNVPGWLMSKAQLLGIRREYEAVNIDLDQFRLTLNPGQELIHSTNMGARRPTW